MGSTAIQFVELATMTISKYSKKLANNILKSNALFAKLYARKRVVTGGKDLQFSLKYKKNPNIGSFSGYDKFTINPSNQFCEAVYPWAMYNAAITFSDEEMAKNDGEERIMNLIESRIKATEEDMINDLNEDMYLDGTGNNSKDMLGLAAIVADAPATGILGGIDRAVDTWWQNKSAAASAAWGTLATLPGRKDVDDMTLQCRIGKSRPDLFLMGTNAYKGLKRELEYVERGSTDFKEKKTWGFIDFGINGMDGVYDEGCPPGKAYCLNTDYLQLTVHSKYNFKPIPAQRPDDQAAFVQHIRTFLQLTTDRSAAHGVITGITVA